MFPLHSCPARRREFRERFVDVVGTFRHLIHNDLVTSSGASTPPVAGHRRRRRRRFLTITGVIGIAVVVGVVVYFEPQTLFIDDKVNETLPGLDAVLAADTTAPTVENASPVATRPDTSEQDRRRQPGTDPTTIRQP